MKIVEIKNSLAKLYYKPSELPLLLSDFLTIDDGNKKLLSQVVSIESTNTESTNCAILKFSLDINENNTYAVYSGYTPALDAKIEKTPTNIIDSVFSSAYKTILIGNLTGSTQAEINLNASVIDKFLYLQSDRIEDTQKFISKLVEFNNDNGLKTLLIDLDGIAEYSNTNVIELGKEFKLPIGNETLNYIYEYDLTGLTLEQKTIVQDIILEIQEYINTLESGFIPFNTLLEVVNDIYDSDKSTGIILLRNKLLKYKQFDIFASTQEEVDTLELSLKNNNVTVLSIAGLNKNWQKEAVYFAVNNIKENYYFILEATDEITDKQLINKIYKSPNIKPIVSSRYDYVNANLVKSYAKNLVLFKPEEQQRAFATYNSFLMKLAQHEFIVSGDATYYTPLIIKETAQKFIQTINSEPEPVIITDAQAITVEDIPQEEEVEVLPADSEDDLSNIEIQPLSEDEILPLEEQIEEEPNELKNIFEESLEQEIAKDVDQMFYAAPAQTEEVFETEESLETEEEIEALPEAPLEEMIDTQGLSDEDLDLLDSLSGNDEEIISNESEELLPDIEQEQNEQILNDNNELSLEESLIAISDEESDDISINIELPNIESSNDLNIDNEFSEPEIQEIAEEPEISEQQSIPIYKTELDENNSDNENVKIAEGNIVYHEKYGRGVVEELFNYGKRTLCSIQFDNVGRRLLDPNLAELKQM